MSTHETARPMSTGQLKDIIATIVGGIPADLTFDEANSVTGAKGRLLEGVVAAFAPFRTNGHAAPAPSTILFPLYMGQEIVVGPTTGEETLAKAKDVFTGWLDSDFERWGTNKPGRKMEARAVAVHEMREKNATFAEMFGSLGGNLDALCMEQGEIVDFCRKHRDKLRQDGYATFFLFKVERQYFVAFVFVVRRKLEAFVYLFDFSDVWRADDRPRVVVPQR